MHTPTSRVSILIVSWNGADLLAKCIQSLSQAIAHGMQVVVVDNGSTPPLRPISGTTWVRSESNLGFAGGNNLGLPQCTGDYVLLLNNDTQLPDLSPIETLVTYLDEHPRVAIAQAKLIRPDGKLDTCGEFLTPLGVLYHHGYGLPDGPHAQKPFPVYASKICKGGFANQAASRFRGIDGKGLLCMRSIGQAIAMVIEDAEWREEFAAGVEVAIGTD